MQCKVRTIARGRDSDQEREPQGVLTKVQCSAYALRAYMRVVSGIYERPIYELAIPILILVCVATESEQHQRLLRAHRPDRRARPQPHSERAAPLHGCANPAL